MDHVRANHFVSNRGVGVLRVVDGSVVTLTVHGIGPAGHELAPGEERTWVDIARLSGAGQRGRLARRPPHVRRQQLVGPGDALPRVAQSAGSPRSLRLAGAARPAWPAGPARRARVCTGPACASARTGRAHRELAPDHTGTGARGAHQGARRAQRDHRGAGHRGRYPVRVNHVAVLARLRKARVTRRTPATAAGRGRAPGCRRATACGTTWTPLGSVRSCTAGRRGVCRGRGGWRPARSADPQVNGAPDE